MLGLLVTPSALLPVADDALLFALVLILVARPLAVWLCLWPFRFPWREQVFIGWVGLRGAVPIILALFPLLAGLNQAPMIFNIVFFVVLVSLLIQGWTVIGLARKLELEVPPSTHLVQRVELDIPGQQELELVGYRLAANAPIIADAAALRTRLPPGARLVAVLRSGQWLDQCGPVQMRADDHVYLLADPSELSELDRLFVAVPEAEAERLSEQAFFGEFVLQGSSRLADLCAFYGVKADPTDGALTLDALMRRELNTHPVVGDRLQLGALELVVRAVEDDRITKVGLKLPREM